MALGGAFALFLPWNSWLSLQIIDSKTQLAAIGQWQEDYGKKIDYLVEHSGGNLQAITKHYNVSTTTKEQSFSQN